MNVTLCMPSVRGELALGALMSAANQTVTPLRAIFYDVSQEGLDPLSFAAYTCGLLKIEVHRGEPMTPQLAAQRYLAEQATTEWLWFVDDDAWPWHDCLEQMIKARNEYEAGLVGATRIDPDHHMYTDPTVHPNDLFYGGPSQGERKQDRQVFTLDGISFLVRRSYFLRCDTSYVPKNGEGGNDIYLMSQLTSKYGIRAVVASQAHVLHYQWYESASSGWPPGISWYEENIKPMLHKADYDRLIRFTRLPFRSEFSPNWRDRGEGIHP